MSWRPVHDAHIHEVEEGESFMVTLCRQHDDNLFRSPDRRFRGACGGRIIEIHTVSSIVLSWIAPGFKPDADMTIACGTGGNVISNDFC